VLVFKVLEGDHECVPDALAVKITELPIQIELVVLVIIGFSITVTVDVLKPAQALLLVPVMV
jgi:hypothetical protein